ncbi:MAG: GDP-L-fucose synthase [Alphaproteobacteria bacterium]|nr:GDP-L-fucose synthase [Alphaproteobacteria bacterium]
MNDGWLETPFDLSGKSVFVAGHRGMVGSALVRRLEAEDCRILTAEGVDFRRQDDVERWMDVHRPDVVVIAAARVGGILANSTRPAEFLYDNAMIAAHLVQAAHVFGVQKLLFLGSSCIYPKDAVQPISEEALLSGPLEPTNEAYALAKIMGVKLCAAYRKQYGCDFISAMPCNLYGPGDRYDAEGSHVIPALMMKAHAVKTGAAEEMVVWGSGTPLREFLYVDDLAEALVFCLQRYSGEYPLNIGSGEEIRIADLARQVLKVVGVEEAKLVFDESRPDGVMRKILDGSRIVQAGWRPRVGLDEGLARSYEDYLKLL